VYLLTGSDRPKIARALRRLRDRIGDDSTEHLNARDATGADAVAACNALGLFVGEGRLVIVDEVER
jgi:DNA polymerase III delta subunit